MTTLAELEARLAALECDRCQCTNCRDRRGFATRGSRIEQIVALSRRPRAELLDAMRAMPPHERRELLDVMQPSAAMDLLADPQVTSDELRAWRQQIPGALWDMIELRRAPTPRMVRLTARAGTQSRRPRVRVDEDVAKRLRAAGVRVDSDNGGQLHYYVPLAFVAHSEAHAPSMVLRGDEYEARLDFDAAFASEVASGAITAVDLNDDQVRAILAADQRVGNTTSYGHVSATAPAVPTMGFKN